MIECIADFNEISLDVQGHCSVRARFGKGRRGGGVRTEVEGGRLEAHAGVRWRKESRAVEVRRTALIGYPAESTFDLIEQAERYPEFLPWCAGATILARDESVVAARLTVDYRGLRFDLTTRNPKRRPHWLAIRMEKGPFRRFDGEWHIRELGAEACKIEFELRYQFEGALVGKLADTVFGHIADTMVDAFAQRADRLGQPEGSGATNANENFGRTS